MKAKSAEIICCITYQLLYSTQNDYDDDDDCQDSIVHLMFSHLELTQDHVLQVRML